MLPQRSSRVGGLYMHVVETTTKIGRRIEPADDWRAASRTDDFDRYVRTEVEQEAVTYARLVEGRRA